MLLVGHWFTRSVSPSFLNVYLFFEKKKLQLKGLELEQAKTTRGLRTSDHDEKVHHEG